MREHIGYRFFFTLFTACFVCLSVAMPNSGGWGPQLLAPAYDFKLPGGEAAADAGAEVGVDAGAGVGVGADADKVAWDGYAPFPTGGGGVGEGSSADAAGAEWELGRYLPSPYGLSEIGGGDIVRLKYNAAGAGAGAGAGAAGAGIDMGVVADADADAGPGAEAMAARANGGAGYVVLDAGHGGTDPGSAGVGAARPNNNMGETRPNNNMGVLEKDVALEVALMTAALLRDAGVETILTRDTDEHVSIGQRIERSGGDGAAFIISVHFDWYKNKSINGTSTLYNAGDERSKALAALIQSHLTHNLGTADRGVHPHSDIILLHEAQVPAALVELAFLSNKHDLALLASDQFTSQAAQNLADGIRAALLLGTADSGAGSE